MEGSDAGGTREAKKLIRSPLTQEVALLVALGVSYSDARSMYRKQRLAMTVAIGELRGGKYDLGSMHWTTPPKLVGEVNL